MMPESSLPPFAALRAFDMVGRVGGIRKGAQALGISHAIVSRHIAALELLLGVVLLDRRSGALTKAGDTYHARIAVALGEIASATQAARVRPVDELTIWCSPGFSLHWLTRRLSEFTRSVPQASARKPVINLRATDSEPDFDRGEADGDIRFHPDYDQNTAVRLSARGLCTSGLCTQLLARPAVLPVIAPALLHRLPAPFLRPSDILDMPLIEEGGDGEWRHWIGKQGIDLTRFPTPVARYGQAHLALAAAGAGQGVALTNRFLVAEELASGRLAQLKPKIGAWKPVTLGAYYFRGPRIRWSDPLLARFRRWLAETIAAEQVVM